MVSHTHTHSHSRTHLPELMYYHYQYHCCCWGWLSPHCHLTTCSNHTPMIIGQEGAMHCGVCILRRLVNNVVGCERGADAPCVAYEA